MNSKCWDTASLQQYEAITQDAAWLDVGPRTEVEISGRDRLRVANNFCTADLTRLQPGQGAEAFILNVKGTTLGHGSFSLSSNCIELSTVADQAECLIVHLRQYVVSEAVEFVDASSLKNSFLLAGPRAGEALSTLEIDKPPECRLDHVRFRYGDVAATIRRTDLLGADGFEIVVDREQKESISRRFQSLGIVQCSAVVLNSVRIENRIPIYGIDLDAKNLPQEIGRNAQAISFNKGCYLGQETVARLDALGHVNRHWVALALDSAEVPEPGPLVDANGQPVIRVTSATWSPRIGGPLVLAYVRHGRNSPGQVISTAIGNATVL